TPEIVWYDDGFLVKYKCPEDTYISGDSLAPESDLSNLFQWESREEGYFFYYRKNGTGGTSMYQHITQEEAGRIMKEEQGYILLDVRTKAEFDKKHIPGAVCIPVTSINKNRAAEELPDVSQTVLVYCRSGHRAQIAAKKLSDLGYTDVREFGGILDWTGETVSE
ncbi:MAG: rhodanese-like domain-containing protein, partial [Lachnospiraceae bacterium]|nr:rhodanese-like domain-containing protein [Lachnospiraceae bacterium]